MPNVFIFHGAYGYPEENWFPWLKGELEEIGCTVFVPKFPTPKGQTLENWSAVFDKFQEHVDKDTIIVGHSTGATFALNVIQGSSKKIRAAFLVSGFISPVVDPENEVTEINKTFYEKKFDWKEIRGNCKSFHVINSDNDPYVPLNLAEEISKPLGVTLTVIEGAGHFNAKAGFTTFPALLDMIEDELTDL